MIAITVEDQGTVFCATKSDGQGRVARGWGDTEAEAREVVAHKPLRMEYED